MGSSVKLLGGVVQVGLIYIPDQVYVDWCSCFYAMVDQQSVGKKTALRAGVIIKTNKRCYQEKHRQIKSL